MPRRKLIIGDVFAVPTKLGFFLGQYTHESDMGSVVRIIDRAFDAVPEITEDVVKTPTRFTTLISLKALINSGYFKVVGRAPVPPHEQPFPVFRGGVIDPRTKRVDVWWLWNGKREWRVGSLNSERMKLPLRVWMGAAALIERLESNWRQEGAHY